VADLVGAGYLTRTREGRRNSYTVKTDLPITLPARRNVALSSLLETLLPAGPSSRDHTGMTHQTNG
jgi:hypothetical protein